MAKKGTVLIMHCAQFETKSSLPSSSQNIDSTHSCSSQFRGQKHKMPMQTSACRQLLSPLGVFVHLCKYSVDILLLKTPGSLRVRICDLLGSPVLGTPG